MWRRELPNPFGDHSAPIVVYEDPNRASIGGEFFLWPASLVLCDYVFRNPSLVRGRKVLELGSSHGLAALATSAAGARRVLATDQEEVMSFLASNVAANPELSVEVAALEWGVGVDFCGKQQGWEWDVVIGSDLTFNRDSFLLLLSTLQQLLCRNDASRDTAENPCRALLLHDDDSVPGGKYMRNEFFNKAAVPYFHVTRADLRSADMSEKRAAKANDFDSSTVHGYWLAPRADAPNVPSVACAESLRRWHRARLEDSERNKVYTHTLHMYLCIQARTHCTHVRNRASSHTHHSHTYGVNTYTHTFTYMHIYIYRTHRMAPPKRSAWE